jgi:hypothetical protein
MKYEINIKILGKTFKKQISANSESEAKEKAKTQFLEFLLKNMKIEIKNFSEKKFSEKGFIGDEDIFNNLMNIMNIK